MYEKLKAILKATSLGRMLVDLVICMKSLKETDEDKFFKLSYEKRIDYIKNAYSAPYKKDYCGDFFDIPEHETKKMLRKTRRWFYDIMLGYAQVINPKSVLQLGGFTMIESQWLVFGGYKGRVIASDYSKDHLAHMQKVFETSSLKNLEYREIDIENPNLRDFEDVDMVATIAVLSNIQPEGMKKLYNVIKDSPVQCVVIGEMYVEESLSVDPKTAKSYPLKNVANWAHPYMAYAHEVGLEAIFIPDFTYSSYKEARGVFIIHRGISKELHAKALSYGVSDYLDRQDEIWQADT